MEFIFLPFSSKRFIYLLLVTVLSFSSFLFLPYTQLAWLVWAALLLATVTIGDDFPHRLAAILLTSVAIITTSFIANLLQPYFVWLAIYLVLLTAGATYLGLRYSRCHWASLIVNLFAIVTVSYPVEIADNLLRTQAILFGALIVVIPLFGLWPHFVRHKLHIVRKAAVRHLAQLNQDIFACLLQPDYAENVYLYERRINSQKDLFLQTIVKARQISTSCPGFGWYENQFQRLDHVFAVMMDYAQLRWRVTDHAVLAVCSDELLGILNEMTNVFMQWIGLDSHRKSGIDTSQLLVRIKYLEDNYHNVLQVAAHEPLVFLFFIAALKSFCDGLDDMAENDRGDK